MILKRYFICVCIILFLCLGPAYAGGEVPGFKYSRGYDLEAFGFQPQNWCVAQDSRGMIYVANQAGIVEYDGVSWKIYNVPNTRTRSLAANKNGTIYIGGRNEIGELILNTGGSRQYKSLTSFINKKNRSFGYVWRTHIIDRHVYFRTSMFIFRWDFSQRRMHTFQAPNKQNFFVGSFVCRGRLLVFRRNVGLMELDREKFRLIPGGGDFTRNWITMVVPMDKKRLLVGTFSNGLYIEDPSTPGFKPWPTGVDDFLKKKRFYHGIALDSSPGHFALATLDGGLTVVDSRGKRRMAVLTKNMGLRDNSVKYLFEDASGNLWAALDNGLTKIEYSSPFTLYDTRCGLDGLVLCAVVHGPDRRLYAGTTLGLFQMLPDGRFKLVHEMRGPCWSLLSTGETLAAATSAGGFVVTGDKKNRFTDAPAFVLYRGRTDPGLILAGTRRGLMTLRKPMGKKNKGKKENWDIKTIDKIKGIRSITEDNRGGLWLGTLDSGVYKGNMNQIIQGGSPGFTRFHTGHGLPPGEIFVCFVAGHVTAAASEGLFRPELDGQKGKVTGFVPDTTLGKKFADGSRNVFRIAQGPGGEIWFHSANKNYCAIRGDHQKYGVKETRFRRMESVQTNAIYPEPSGQAAWFATHKGLVRFDTGYKKKNSTRFRAFIRSVTLNGKPVSPDLPPLPYRQRNLRITFAAPYYTDEARTRYRFFLEGYDHGWSPWTSETWKDYTNLGHGGYRFRVMARDVFMRHSQEAELVFSIDPPWFFSWWVFVLYAAAFVLLVYGLVRWRSRKLRREKAALEKVVEQRTVEIREKNVQLEEQSEKLKEMDRVKSRFFANISHEFRTPLTLIVGPAERMLESDPTGDRAGSLRMMLRSSRQLLALINQLLDLSKIDGGSMSLKAAPRDLGGFVKAVAEPFRFAASRENIEFLVEVPDEPVEVYLDKEKMEHAIANLLSNAVKFTPPGGTIRVEVSSGAAAAKGFENGFAQVSVADTGAGIPAGQVEHIFDRFFQAGAQDHKPGKQKGTGIGLSLVKEMVALHNGKIDVHTAEGKGTTFIIRLPLGRGHLDASQVAASVTAEEEPLELSLLPGAADPGYAEDEPAENEPGLDSGKEIILVVEDNRDVRTYIREPLAADYTVVEAADGKEGIEKAKKWIPDLIISDVMMPGADGYELCEALKTDMKTCHIPVILLTAKASEQSVVKGLETGADDYITKPFNTKILCTRVKNLIDLRRQLQEKIQREMKLQPSEINVSSLDRQFMEELKDAIEKKLEDPDFDIDQLAADLYMSRATLNRKLRALTGESSHRFIRSFRLKRARQLLTANFGNVTEVAYAVGFSSSAYFTRCFKEKFHQLPHTFLAAEGG